MCDEATLIRTRKVNDYELENRDGKTYHEALPVSSRNHRHPCFNFWVSCDYQACPQSSNKISSLPPPLQNNMLEC